MRSIQQVILIIFILLSSSFLSVVSADEEQVIECEILTDWGFDSVSVSGPNNTSLSELSIVHQYVVSFSPIFVNGSNPHLVDISITHLRDEQIVGNEFNSNIIIAGGLVDII